MKSFRQLDNLIERQLDRLEEGKLAEAKLPSLMRKFIGQLPLPLEKMARESFPPRTHPEVSAALGRLFAKGKSRPYFEAMLPLAFFYWQWLGARPFQLAEEKVETLLRSLFFGAIGYRLLDGFTDQKKCPSPEAGSRVLLAHHLISLQESTLLEIFRDANVYAHYHQRYLGHFTEISLTEQKLRVEPEEIYKLPLARFGHKSAPLMSYFALALAASGEGDSIGKYETMFFQVTAAIQLLDDIADFAEDLDNGNVTLLTAPALSAPNLSDSSVEPDPAQVGHYLEQALLLCQKALMASRKLNDEVFEVFILLRLGFILQAIESGGHHATSDH